MFERFCDRQVWRCVSLAVLLSGVHSTVAMPVAGQETATPSWTLAEALDLAFTHSPVLLARRQAVEEVRAGLVGARTYPHNPEITLELADRTSPGGSTADRGISISQEIEIAGQRGKRIAVASADLDAAEAAFSRQRCWLAFQVETAFAEAIRARDLLVVTEADAALAREMLEFSTRRTERGAGTQIEINLARAGSGRAERRPSRDG